MGALNPTEARRELDWQLRFEGLQLTFHDSEVVWRAVEQLLEAAYTSGYDQGYSEGSFRSDE